VQNDNRFFAKTKVDGEEILALLDTGASANCIDRRAHAFLKNRTRPIRKLSEECVRTASGGETFCFWGLNIGRFLTEEKLEKQREAFYCRLIQRLRR